MGNEQCKRLHISSFSTFTFFSQTPYSSDFPVRPLSFVPPHLTSNFPDYHTNRISTFDSAFFPPNITCYDSTDNYCKNPQQLCSNTATVLQCRCNQLCSSAATALQCRCNSFAVTLQQVCNDAAFPCSEADNKQLPICAPLTEGGYKIKQVSPKKPMNREFERKGERAVCRTKVAVLIYDTDCDIRQVFTEACFSRSCITATSSKSLLQSNRPKMS